MSCGSGPVVAIESLTLKRQLAELRQQLEDRETERAFWQRAAEQALRLWDRSQDELELARMIIRKTAPIDGISSLYRIHSAAVVIDVTGKVIKDRYGLFDESPPEDIAAKE